MSKPMKSNVVPLKAPDERKSSSTERIWGKAVVSHGYAGIPSLLIRNQARLGLSPTQMNLIVQLLEYWFDPSRPPFPTKRQLADRMGVNPKTIQINMRELENAGYVKREPQKTSAGDWGSNIYHLDGLVEKIRGLEPEFTAARQKKAEIDKTTETPVGKRVGKLTSRRSSKG